MNCLARLVCWLYAVQIFSCRCCNCCDCDDSVDKSLENAIITEEDRKITPLILKHLKLDGDTLNAIVTEVNKCSDNVEKIKKILEYTVDIDWNNPMCPNTLIRQEKNSCIYISYFHLMLNNPYFLKFFLICDKIKSLHRPDTYVLDAMCELVRWCVERPSFNKNNMGSIDKIIKAFYKENTNGEYFYCAKDDKASLQLYYYGSIDEKTGKYIENCGPHKYGSWQNSILIDYVHTCLLLDLNIKDNDIENKIRLLIIYRPKVSLAKAKIHDILKSPQINSEYFNTQDNVKLLGLALYQQAYHYYVIVYNNNQWYNKNTLLIDSCRPMTIEEVTQLCEKIVEIKKPKYKQLNQEYCEFTGVKISNTQSS